MAKLHAVLHHCTCLHTNRVEQLLNADEVTRMLRVSRRTLESIISRDDGPRFLLVGRQRRWRNSDVQSWIESRIAETRTSMQSKEVDSLTN